MNKQELKNAYLGELKKIFPRQWGVMEKYFQKKKGELVELEDGAILYLECPAIKKCIYLGYFDADKESHKNAIERALNVITNEQGFIDENMRASFEKRVRSYLKRYGLKNVRARFFR